MVSVPDPTPDSTVSPTPASARTPPATTPLPDDSSADAAALLEDAAAPAELDPGEIDKLLKDVELDVASQIDDSAAGAEDFKLPDFQQVMRDAAVSSIDLLRDVDLNVKIELGRSRMLVEDVLKLGEGAVVELDKLAGDPVDVFVNDRLIARGEVLVLNENFCVRINEIISGAREEG
jgi:flagellar motor switch protein FliN/FliY